MDIKDQKKAIRQAIRQAKPNLKSDDYMAAGRSLLQALADRPDVAQADAIVAYWPLPDELNTGPFIAEIVRRGKRVFLPVIVGKELVFREFTGYKCLRREERFGILEPQGTEELDVSRLGEGAVVIVPGMAFTRQGDRLGRGRGFYDRALSMLTRARRIGVCYECQVLESLPTEEHDLRMDDVVSIKI